MKEIARGHVTAEDFHGLACFKQRLDPGLASIPAPVDVVRDVACAALVELFGALEGTELLDACSKVLEPLGACGVESISSPESHTEGFSYINFGGTYDATLLLGEDGSTVYVGSWGDYLESAEEEHAEDTDRTRCSHCGEWYDNAAGPCHGDDGFLTFYVVRVNGGATDTCSGRTLAEALEGAMADEGDKVEYRIVRARDAGAARLNVSGKWKPVEVL